MQAFLRFWRKDAVNKLIVLVVVLMIAVAGIQLYLLFGTPRGQALLSNIQPTATLSVEELFQRGEATKTASVQQTLAAVVPTITTMPFTPMVMSPTPTATMAPRLDPTFTPTFAGTPFPTQTRTPAALSDDCPPGKEYQQGKVVEVIDGNTIRVLVDDLVYVVRYLGVDLPENLTMAQLSTVQNGQWVFMKEVKLFSDGDDKDASNRLLRYVVVGESLLVNQELIRQGYATASTTTYSCAARFSAAENEAKMEKQGLWQGNQP